MNAHFFGAKRAFHATLRFARPLLARFGLTPARFDLLFALTPCAYYRDHRPSCLQRDLRKKLGVTAPTVCRMLQSLEKLGLIERRRSVHDKRQRYVALTDDGLSRMESILGDLVDSDFISFAVDCALGESRWYDEGHCLVEKDAAQSMLTRLRRAFGDFATLVYPWHPDD